MKGTASKGILSAAGLAIVFGRLLLPTGAAVVGDEPIQLPPDATVRWASSGGGWRSMLANVGFVRAFERAGLINEDGCVFTAASFTSGASWFGAQLFFSEPFFARVIGDDKTADDVYNLSKEWLDSYRNYLDDNASLFCEALSLFGLLRFTFVLAIVTDGCNTFVQPPWVEFVEGMLESASNHVYSDENFASRQMDSSTKVSSLRNTIFMVQTALSESSRYGQGINKRYSFVSVSGKERALAVPVPVQYTVTSKSTSFRYGVEGGQKLVTSTAAGQRWFSFPLWKDWYGYSTKEQGNVFSQRTLDGESLQPFKPPFNDGKATVSQVTAASSSALASFSGSVPSFLFHHYSVALADAGNFIAQIPVYLELTHNYLNPMFFNNAVCTDSDGVCSGGDTGAYGLCRCSGSLIGPSRRAAD